ncbi:MerR family transcriptional regulator [Aquirhabdus parva]|uniref:MerR family transcriptional regulator n=1 Tax=Aquirhabdus parva TaxID=2283318 RepID=A0A345P4R5_9GAMM|nr:MerR family transcriptional regulator [Aquirhabdus parva]AXI02274.1 MerR family transcriptional regulator [Aquirhabdus parva]
MKIGELAKQSGLASSRIRFYEARGLIGKVHRKANGYREYPAQTLQLLRIITCAQQVGFTLEEIHNMLPENTKGWQHDELLTRLRQKILEIDALQQRLTQNKAQLLSIIDSIENKPEHLECSANAQRVLAQLEI